jgi:hypothetical protein
MKTRATVVYEAGRLTIETLELAPKKEDEVV